MITNASMTKSSRMLNRNGLRNAQNWFLQMSYQNHFYPRLQSWITSSTPMITITTGIAGNVNWGMKPGR